MSFLADKGVARARSPFRRMLCVKLGGLGGLGLSLGLGLRLGLRLGLGLGLRLCL